jgi:RHS repeat-associated protein
MTNELWWEGTNIVRSIVFGFNELGVQTLAADPAARYEYSYDALNRLERVLSQSAGVPDFTLLYTYTALGQVETVTDNYGVRVGSGYDNRNRLASRTWSSTLPGGGVDPARVDFAYDASGNRLRTDRFVDLAGANRIGFTTNAYNRAGIVTNITHLGPTGSVLAKYDYNFDAAYQITRWAIGNQLSDFAYDRTGQLTNALNTTQPNENFRFDANGNRVGAQSGGSYVVGGNNQILSDGTNRYAYDFEGNMTSRSNTVTGVLTTYQWDHRNRLVSVLDYNPGGVLTQTVAFVYDAMNRRLAKTVNGQTTRFLYNGDNSWADLDNINAVTACYLYGARIDELLARNRASDGWGWYLTDHLGTVRDIANAAGAVVAHLDYSGFGQVLGVLSNVLVVDRFGFAGREIDVETGLNFHRARFYSAALGRFVSQDPIGFDSDDANLFRYVGNSPVLLTDPRGTQSLAEYVVLAGTFSAIAGFYTGFFCYLKNGDASLLYKAPLWFIAVTEFALLVTVVTGGAAALSEGAFLGFVGSTLAFEEFYSLADCLFGFDDPF